MSDGIIAGVSFPYELKGKDVAEAADVSVING